MAFMTYVARLGKSYDKVVAETIVSCLDSKANNPRYPIQRDNTQKSTFILAQYCDSRMENVIQVRVGESLGMKKTFTKFTNVLISGTERQIRRTKSKLLRSVRGLELI